MSDTTNQPLPADPPDNGGGTKKALQDAAGSTPLPADPPDNGGGTEG
jgi:hypothetical protein